MGKVLCNLGHSIIRKLVRPKIRRALKDYFRLHRSKNVKKRLEEKSLRYIERQKTLCVIDRIETFRLKVYRACKV